MNTVEVTIQHEAGLHARPAAIFVKTASGFQSTISLRFGEKTVNAKSIVQVLTLGANKGSTVTIAAEGPDADAAIQALVGLVERNFALE